MDTCTIKECKNQRLYRFTNLPFCEMHKARIRRNGYPGLKKDAYQSTEILPHPTVDEYIERNYKIMSDAEIRDELKKMGHMRATVWAVSYRRKKLGFKKYSTGDIERHKSRVKAKAIKRFGKACELCDYNSVVVLQYILARKIGGNDDYINLIIVCPNCQSLIRKRIIKIESRGDIANLREKIKKITNLN